MRWEIIDSFEVLKKNKIARARKFFSGSEDFFKEHFPGQPLVPEPLLVEMIAQSGGVLFGLGLGFKKEVILAKISKTTFNYPVAPPCTLVVEARMKEEREEGAWISGEVRQEERLVATAEILLATVETQSLGLQRKIVFNDHFMKHYDIDRIAQKSENFI